MFGSETRISSPMTSTTRISAASVTGAAILTCFPPLARVNESSAGGLYGQIQNLTPATIQSSNSLRVLRRKAHERRTDYRRHCARGLRDFGLARQATWLISAHTIHPNSRALSFACEIARSRKVAKLMGARASSSRACGLAINTSSSPDLMKVTE